MIGSGRARLETRDDLQRAVGALAAPVRERLSPGGALARLGATGALFADTAAGLEGWARPLWGLVPLAAGGGEVDWAPYLRGLRNGVDPDHEEYWGTAGQVDQRLVEMAALGLALAMVPEQVWEPLDAVTRARLDRWLSRINEVDVADNNWHFFRVLVNEGLGRVGAPGHDPEAAAKSLDRLEEFSLGDGWYSDGEAPQRDYYVPFAMHFYGLVYARLAGDRDPGRAARFRERAALFARDFAHWFDDDGAALPYGRSLTYRFAQGAFWGALAFADVEALPWGQVKGLALRHLRWWAGQPVTDHSGLLTIGYAYPNLLMAEDYNSPGSPYWALKFFLPLALPESHPFWQAEEAPAPERTDAVSVQPHAGMVISRDPAAGHVVALAGGQQNTQPWVRNAGDKYAKFAYSTAFGFSVPAGRRGLEQTAADSMLALSDDDTHWRVRETCEEHGLHGEVLWSRWRPLPGAEVETWLLPWGPWHVRVHRLVAERELYSAEGGWALDRTGDDLAAPVGRQEAAPGWAFARYPAGGSGVRDLYGARTGEVVRPCANTNVLRPRTLLPTLRARHEPGEHWLACAVLGTRDGAAFTEVWSLPPTAGEVRAAVASVRRD
ncbi:DUF2264 domain-containing protein [Streptomyces sp. NPDC051940]|uniref:DUF2264 domain-containing protein n=1 Tax=Streptomyces sp. NPDC051940 TaxID=3155675 RepID=UPI00342CB490